MRKITFILSMFLFAMSIFAEISEKDNNTQKSSPSDKILTDKSHQGNKRSVVELPVIRIEENTLVFVNHIPSCVLQLVDETGNIFYETYIPEGTEQWQLPTDELEGCELRLIIDGVCYYCIL